MSDQEEMEQMATSLQRLLQSGDANVQLAAMRTLCEVVKEAEYFRQMFLLRWCYSILQSTIQYYMKNVHEMNEGSRRLTYYATKVMRFSTFTLGEANISCGFEEDEASFILSQFIPHWAAVNCECLAAYVNQPESVLKNLPMLIDLCCTLSYVLDYFAEDCGMDLKAVCSLAFAVLRTVESHYHHSDIDDYSGYSSDGDRIDLEILVLHLFELINTGMSNSRFDDSDTAGNGVFDENDRETVDGTVRLLTSFMMLGQSQVDLWVESPNDYTLIEYDDVQETDYLRNVCAEVLREICCGSKGAVYLSIMSAAQAEFTAKQPLLQQYLSSGGSSGADGGIAQAARVIETYLWVLGIVGKGYVSALLKSRRIVSKQAAGGGKENSKTGKYAAITEAAPPQDVISLVHTVAVFVLDFPAAIALQQQNGASANDVSLALLQYRVLWLCGEIIYLFQGAHIICAIAKKCEGLLNPANYLSLRLQACRTLARILKHPKAYTEALEEGQPASADGTSASASASPLELHIDTLVEGVTEMIPHCNENSLHVPFETLRLLVRSHGGRFSESAVNHVTQVSLQVMSHFCNDSILVEIASDALVQVLKACPCDILCRVTGTICLEFTRHAVFDETQRARLPASCVETFLLLLSKMAVLITRRDAGEESVPLTRSVLELLIAAVSVPALMHRHAGCIMRAVTGVLECMPQEPLDRLQVFQGIPLPAFANTLLLAVNSTIQTLYSASSEPGANEADFAPAMGMYCHLTLKASHLTGIEAFGAVLVSAFQAAQHEKASTRRRHTLCMSVVNLLARNAGQTLHLLNHTFDIAQNDSRSFFFATWEQMHESLASRYNLFVSCVALVEVLGSLRSVAGMDAMKVKMLEMLFNKLPTLLASNGEQDGNQRARADVWAFDSDGEDEEGSYQDDEYESSLDADDFESNASDIELEGDEDGEEDSPFAPAELYLSDLVGGSGGGGGDDDSYTAALASAVPEDIMYQLAERSDPLLDLSAGVDSQIQTAAQVQKRVVSVLTLLRQEQADFPTLINQLSSQHQSQIQTLFIL